MRILLIGATGLIGAAVAARLDRDGHALTGVGRSAGADARRLPIDRWVRLDLRQATAEQDWLAHLQGIEAVVNCAGVLQDSGRDSTARVHRDAPAALWRACAQAGVRRVIQMSAMGVDRGALTDFSRSKAEGDAALEASGLDWVILRPSVVVGRPAYGGSALLRGLAALPVVPRTPDAGPLDIVQLDDVAETVARLLRPGAASRVALELAGPDRLGFDEVIAAYRRWLGWRPPVRSTARREIVRGATGDGRAWREATGIEPQSLAAALAAEPASVQERWFARLYLLKPVAIGCFSLFWLVTGLVSLGPGFALAIADMQRGGAGPLSAPGVVAGAAADILIGCAIAWRPTARRGLQAALLVSLFYVVAGTLLLPGLWRDPLGPMMKIWPVLTLNLLCLAILDER